MARDIRTMTTAELLKAIREISERMAAGGHHGEERAQYRRIHEYANQQKPYMDEIARRAEEGSL